jgi:hypothetical protein
MSAFFTPPSTKSERDDLHLTAHDLVMIKMFADGMSAAMRTVCTRHPNLRACQGAFDDAVRELLAAHVDEPLIEAKMRIEAAEPDGSTSRDYWWHMGRVL